MGEQLKPCPFCGGEGRMNREADPDGFGYFIAIECRNCRARSRPKYYSNGNDCPQTYQECRDEWNTRPEAAQVRVKPLEWENIRETAAIADTALGQYHVYKTALGYGVRFNKVWIPMVITSLMLGAWCQSPTAVRHL